MSSIIPADINFRKNTTSAYLKTGCYRTMITLPGLNYLKCLAIIVFCILIVMQSFAQEVPHSAAPDIQKMTRDSVQSPNDDCPCKDTHDNGQCDSSCTCCATFAALPERITFYTQLRSEFIYPVEPSRSMPQVYLPIFVPPQNSSWS